MTDGDTYGDTYGDTETETNLPVVVGVDGSDDSLAAADLAASEAARRSLPLELIYAFAPAFLARPSSVPPDIPPVAPAPPLPDDELRRHAEEALHSTAQRVRANHPDLPVVTRLRDGYPAGVLTDASRQAALLVVGHRGRGGFAGLLAGSVGVQLASHAACPVIINRGRSIEEHPVVVGVDGSEGAQRAAAFAIEAAAAYGAPLVAMYVWPWEEGWAPEQVQAGSPPPEMPDAPREALRDLAGKHPQVTVHPEVHTQVAAHEALVGASAAARLVVVGSRGRGGFRGLLLGSVSQALIHHAQCPVAVVGPEAA